MGGGGGGGASGIYAGATPLLVAGGGGGGGAAGKNSSYKDMNGGDGGGENGGNGQGDLGGFGATQSSHGVRGGNSKPGTDSGGGNADNIQSGNPGGGAGGGWTRGYAGSSGTYYGTFMGSPTLSSGPGGGGSGGASYTGGVKSLSDNPKGFEWAHPEANDNGKVRITEYMMGYSAGVPNSTADYTVSAPSKTLVTSGESYTFTITRTSGTGHIGLVLNSGNGILELTSIDGSVFTYTVSNVQGSISAEDFSVTTFNVNAPPNGIGYIISAPSSTNVIRGGSYTFVVELDAGYACPIVTLNSTNGKINYSSVINNKMTITISNVLGEIFAEDFTVLVSKLT